MLAIKTHLKAADRGELRRLRPQEAERLRRRYGVRVVLRRFSFIDRASDSGGCDTCGVPLCCATWSGARDLGPVNVRLAKQQGVTPNEKIIGCCGEVKCCMRYEHDAYKEFPRSIFGGMTTLSL